MPVRISVVKPDGQECPSYIAVRQFLPLALLQYEERIAGVDVDAWIGVGLEQCFDKFAELGFVVGR